MMKTQTPSQRAPRILLLLVLGRPTFWPMYAVPIMFGFLAEGDRTNYLQLVGLIFWYALWAWIQSLLNELADRVEDVVNQPERARLLEMVGIDFVKRVTAWPMLSVCALLFGLWVRLTGGTAAMTLCLLSLLPVVLYNRGPRLKKMGGIWALLGLGWTILFSYWGAFVWNRSAVFPPIGLLLVMMAATMLLQALKDVPDIQGDTSAGIHNMFSKYARLNLLHRALYGGFLIFFSYLLLVLLVLVGILPRAVMLNLITLPAAFCLWIHLLVVNLKDRDETLVLYQENYVLQQLSGIVFMVAWYPRVDVALAGGIALLVRLLLVALRMDPRLFVYGDWSRLAPAWSRLNLRCNPFRVASPP